MMPPAPPSRQSSVHSQQGESRAQYQNGTSINSFSSGYPRNDSIGSTNNQPGPLPQQQVMAPANQHQGADEHHEVTLRWLCDKCQRSAFDSAEAATAHEAVCTFNRNAVRGGVSDSASRDANANEEPGRRDINTTNASAAALLGVDGRPINDTNSDAGRDAGAVSSSVARQEYTERITLVRPSQVDTTAHSAAAGDEAPPPILAGLEGVHGEQKWVCDICKVLSFEDYEDACRHEATCNGPPPRASVASASTEKNTYSDGDCAWTCDICNDATFVTHEEACRHEATCTGVPPRSSENESASVVIDLTVDDNHTGRAAVDARKKCIRKDAAATVVGESGLSITTKDSHAGQTTMNAAENEGARAIVDKTGLNLLERGTDHDAMGAATKDSRTDAATIVDESGLSTRMEQGRTDQVTMDAGTNYDRKEGSAATDESWISSSMQERSTSQATADGQKNDDRKEASSITDESRSRMHEKRTDHATMDAVNKDDRRNQIVAVDEPGLKQTGGETMDALMVDDRRKEASIESNDDSSLKWLCSVCNVAAFNTEEEACGHEKGCSNYGAAGFAATSSSVQASDSKQIERLETSQSRTELASSLDPSMNCMDIGDEKSRKTESANVAVAHGNNVTDQPRRNEGKDRHGPARARSKSGPSPYLYWIWGVTPPLVRNVRDEARYHNACFQRSHAAAAVETHGARTEKEISELMAEMIAPPPQYCRRRPRSMVGTNAAEHYILTKSKLRSDDFFAKASNLGSNSSSVGTEKRSKRKKTARIRNDPSKCSQWSLDAMDTCRKAKKRLASPSEGCGLVHLSETELVLLDGGVEEERENDAEGEEKPASDEVAWSCDICLAIFDTEHEAYLHEATCSYGINAALAPVTATAALPSEDDSPIDDNAAVDFMNGDATSHSAAMTNDERDPGFYNDEGCDDTGMDSNCDDDNVSMLYAGSTSADLTNLANHQATDGDLASAADEKTAEGIEDKEKERKRRLRLQRWREHDEKRKARSAHEANVESEPEVVILAEQCPKSTGDSGVAYWCATCFDGPYETLGACAVHENSCLNARTSANGNTAPGEASASNANSSEMPANNVSVPKLDFNGSSMLPRSGLD